MVKMPLRRQRGRQQQQEEHHIFRGAEILRHQILQQLDAMEEQQQQQQQPTTGSLLTSKERFYSSSAAAASIIDRKGWRRPSSSHDTVSAAGEPALLDMESSSSSSSSSYDTTTDTYEYHHEVRAIGRAPSADWSVPVAADADPLRTIDLSKSYRFRSVSGLDARKRNDPDTMSMVSTSTTTSDVVLLSSTTTTASSALFGTTPEAARLMVLDDPEHFTFTNEEGDNVPVVSPEEKRQDGMTNCSPAGCSDFRKGDADQAQRILHELRGGRVTSSTSTCSSPPISPRRSQEVSRRPRQAHDSNNNTQQQQQSLFRRDRQTTPSKQRIQPPQLPLFTQERSTSSPSPRRRQISAPRATTQDNYRTARTVVAQQQQRHQSTPRRRFPERKVTKVIAPSSSYAPLPEQQQHASNDAAAASPQSSWRRQRPEQPKLLFPGFSRMPEGPAARRRQRQRAVVDASRTPHDDHHIQLYRQIMSDPAYVHAMQAGFLWQSLVGQHMKFPSRWWNGRRGPTMGQQPPAAVAAAVSTTVPQPWVYLGRQSVLSNYVLQKLVQSRASGGRLLLHIVVVVVVPPPQQPTTTSFARTVMDMALGCFHPNAKEVRDTQQALRHLESCRDVWIAVRKHVVSEGVFVPSALDTLLSLPDRTSRSPLGPGVRVDNTNVRAVFGEKPPLETLVLTEHELQTRLAPRIERGESPPLAVLQEFVFA